MEEDAIDLKYAKEVADFIGSNHHEIIINKDDFYMPLNPSSKLWQPLTLPQFAPALECI